MEEFKKARKEHEEVSSVSKFNVIITGEEAFGQVIKQHGATQFTGYGETSAESKVLALLKDGKVVEHVEEGDEVDVILDSTPFYAESGGQLGDIGILESDGGRLAVTDTQKHEGLFLHKAKALSGMLQTGDKLKATVDKERRTATVLHHSTAHIFHAAIREYFGKHVLQAGSQVGPVAMRFDFTLERQPKPEELKKVEAMMNEWVRLNYPVLTQEMSLDDAKKTGAVAMFGEKYGDRVRVVGMGDFSLEFCGGTHVNTTGEIGPIKIISEESVSSGTRRVQALAGQKAWTYISERLGYLSEATEKLKVRPSELIAQIERLQELLKQKDKLTQSLEEKIALSRIPELQAKARQVGDIKLISERLENVSADGLKTLAESLRNGSGNTVCALASSTGPGQVSIVVGVPDGLVKKGFNAGELAKAAATICGGGGGGRPQLAQAGGKNPEAIDQALSRICEMVEEKLAKC